jgi:hypothetical protein
MLTSLSLIAAFSGPLVPGQGSLENYLPLMIGQSKAFRNPVISDGNLTGPEDIGVVHFFKVGKEFEPLEMSRGFLRRVSTGIFSNRFGIQVQGPKSPIRFTQGKIPNFLVTILPWQYVPTKWECFQLDSKGDFRFLQFSNENGFAEVQGPRGVHVRPSHYVGDVYRLKVENLPPGEYGFKYGVSSDEKDLYCFGVDPAN